MMNSRSTFSEIIDRRPISSFQLRVFVLCSLVLVLDGFDTQSIGFLAPAVADSLHLPITAFGPVFAAALVGLMISSLCAGPIADRVGRKWPTVVATVIFATFTLAATQATSLLQLAVFRFLTGLGLGGALPNAMALASEFAPQRVRRILVTVISCGMPLGALLGGLVSSAMLPMWGWRSVFYVGGGLPLLIALILIWGLPESILFLGINGLPQKAAGILAKIAPELRAHAISNPSPATGSSIRSPAVTLFTEGRALGTILLWVPFFMNLLVLYFIVSWLPALLRQSSQPITMGIVAISLFSLGGILGSVVQGKLMTKWGDLSILLGEFLVTVALMGALAFSSTKVAIIAMTFLLGCFVQGAQAGLNALSVKYYPTSMRATGVGWALGVGRLGSIVGPMLGGMMLARGWSTREILMTGSVPAFVSAMALLISRAVRIGPYLGHAAEDRETGNLLIKRG